MSNRDQQGGILNRIFGRSRSRSAGESPGSAEDSLRDVIIDATAYGVTIVPADVAPGEWHWRAVRIHHLTPEENGGGSHLHLDLREAMSASPSRPLGEPVQEARVRIAWQGDQQLLTIGPGADETTHRFMLGKWQQCSVEVLGPVGEELPSDRVEGLHAAHPGEGTGNSLFHHSFSLTFLRVQAPEKARADSMIQGVVLNSNGGEVLLQRGERVVARRTLDGDAVFRFDELEAGDYQVSLADGSLKPVRMRVDGGNRVSLALRQPRAESVLGGRVLRGAGSTIELLRGGERVATQTIAEDGTFAFETLPAGIYALRIGDTGDEMRNVTVNGVESRQVLLALPDPDKKIQHYVLFGPAEQPSTEVNLLLAQEFLLAFEPAFGFIPAEAAQASLVTIIADETAVSPQVAARLAAEGASVQRISGPIERVVALLAHRVTGGHPFAS